MSISVYKPENPNKEQLTYRTLVMKAQNTVTTVIA